MGASLRFTSATDLLAISALLDFAKRALGTIRPCAGSLITSPLYVGHSSVGSDIGAQIWRDSSLVHGAGLPQGNHRMGSLAIQPTLS
jgi:hypothetical protein